MDVLTENIVVLVGIKRDYGQNLAQHFWNSSHVLENSSFSAGSKLLIFTIRVSSSGSLIWSEFIHVPLYLV